MNFTAFLVDSIFCELLLFCGPSYAGNFSRGEKEATEAETPSRKIKRRGYQEVALPLPIPDLLDH